MYRFPQRLDSSRLSGFTPSVLLPLCSSKRHSYLIAYAQECQFISAPHCEDITDAATIWVVVNRLDSNGWLLVLVAEAHCAVHRDRRGSQLAGPCEFLVRVLRDDRLR